MIVYGWNSFKIRSFTLQDLGIYQKTETEPNFEVR